MKNRKGVSLILSMCIAIFVIVMVYVVGLALKMTYPFRHEFNITELQASVDSVRKAISEYTEKDANFSLLTDNEIDKVRYPNYAGYYTLNIEGENEAKLNAALGVDVKAAEGTFGTFYANHNGDSVFLLKNHEIGNKLLEIMGSNYDLYEKDGIIYTHPSKIISVQIANAQNKVTGYQLFDYENTNAIDKEDTVKKEKVDNKKCYVKTAKKEEVTGIVLDKEYNLHIEDGKKYVMSMDIKASNETTWEKQIFKINKQELSFENKKITKEWETYKFEFTGKKVNGEGQELSMFAKLKAGEKLYIGNITLAEKTDDINLDTLKWQEYKGTKLSPKTGVEINRVKDKFEIITCGMNLFDSNKVETETNIEKRVNNNELSIIKRSPVESNAFVAKYKINLRPNTKYTLYTEVDKINSVELHLYKDYLKGNEYKPVVKTLENKACYTFTTDKNGKLIIGFYSKEQKQNEAISFVNTMLLEGEYTFETMPQYQAYGEVKIEANLNDQEMLPGDEYIIKYNLKDKKFWKYLKKNYASQKFTGSESAWNTLDKNKKYSYFTEIENISNKVDKCYSNYFEYNNIEAYNGINEFTVGGTNPNRNKNIIFNLGDEKENKLPEFKEWMKSNKDSKPLEVVYPLKNPQIIQMGPIEGMTDAYTGIRTTDNNLTIRVN